MSANDPASILVFATSDKGGTGRSVTSCNIAYRLWLRGLDVAYVDFDFGSPTAGALFEIGGVERGVTEGHGLHSYLLGQTREPTRINVGRDTDRPQLRRNPPRAGSLTLLPGDIGGGEFGCNDASVRLGALLLANLLNEFAVVIVDLSAGRSVALEIALRATASTVLRNHTHRWLVFHRWTRQHVLAAGGLVHGAHGLLETATAWGHAKADLLASMRCVRTAVAESDSTRVADPAQATWLKEQANSLRELATANGIGAAMMLGQTPIEPMLQWREQLILDADVGARLANPATVAAYTNLARRLTDSTTWDTGR
ncbi:SCO2523 family variant P-loop protein [Nocardia caishijiensis]|uniref:CobQ/CobB/MinD/ParA family nucleotide binding protein n=1 Tax=Nocardia caishijiensis TaxID=184756 RepID=A0ABQ6YKN6_9NOCA|nr:SCO2523 family variant P-loop protein [Nocardia caishijiensis]KAF0846347.1 CobQ/CobB/MinD/ParA family nucleotide binding protein [Nocardia caishijiensis]